MCACEGEQRHADEPMPTKDGVDLVLGVIGAARRPSEDSMVGFHSAILTQPPAAPITGPPDGYDRVESEVVREIFTKAPEGSPRKARNVPRLRHPNIKWTESIPAPVSTPKYSMFRCASITHLYSVLLPSPWHKLHFSLRRMTGLTPGCL